MRVPKRSTQTVLYIAILVGLMAWLAIRAISLQAQEDPVATEEALSEEAQAAADIAVPNPDSSDIAERGMYLVHVEIACTGCHGASNYFEDPLGVALSGGRMFELPFGNVYAPNLTTLQDWTDNDIEFAIRYGQRPDGSVLLPPMSYHLHEAVADEDMNAIIAYLRTLEPVDNIVPEAELAEGLTRDMIRTVPDFDPEAVFSYPEGMEDDLLVRGIYLANHTSHCVACHGSVDEDGMVIIGGPATGEAIEFYPPLLQEDLAEWSDDDLRAWIRNIEAYEMPTYAYQFMVPEDVDALIAWLRSQPARADLE